ncbi:response regulator [Spirosoma lituiforme]
MTNAINPKRRKANRTPILVVENNADHWLIIRSALAQCFPEVEPIWMNHSTQTLSYLDKCSSDNTKLPRLILLEPYLPSQEDGWALLKSIKAHPQYQHIPIITLSHSQDYRDIVKSYSFSVAAYITKPTVYHKWLSCFYTLRRYWWELAILPTPTLLPD